MDFGEVRTSGVSSQLEADGESLAIRIERIEMRDLRAQTARGSLRAAAVELAKVEARISASLADGPLARRLRALTVGELRVKDARLELRDAPRPGSSGAARPGAWRLEPLEGLEGSLHADIVDAAWIFDAEVTVPVHAGRIDFNQATVEHVGPDSSMGVSRMGVYVDAPNGRTYLFLFSTTHVPGARFERRDGGLLPGWRGDRGSIELRPLIECLLSGLPLGKAATGMRDMVARTRSRGDFQLADGVIGDDRRRIVLAGRERGRNRVAISSLPSGRGFVLLVPEFSAGELRTEWSRRVVSAGPLSASASVQVEEAAGAFETAASVADLVLHDLRVADPD